MSKLNGRRARARAFYALHQNPALGSLQPSETLEEPLPRYQEQASIEGFDSPAPRYEETDINNTASDLPPSYEEIDE